MRLNISVPLPASHGSTVNVNDALDCLTIKQNSSVCVVISAQWWNTDGFIRHVSDRAPVSTGGDHPHREVAGAIPSLCSGLGAVWLSWREFCSETESAAFVQQLPPPLPFVYRVSIIFLTFSTTNGITDLWSGWAKAQNGIHQTSVLTHLSVK